MRGDGIVLGWTFFPVHEVGSIRRCPFRSACSLALWDPRRTEYGRDRSGTGKAVT